MTNMCSKKTQFVKSDFPHKTLNRTRFIARLRLNKWPNISPKPAQNSTSTEPCFGWGWIFTPESPNRVQHSLKMAQQRPNIASKWANISPKPTQKLPPTEKFSVGGIFFGPKAASRTPNDPTKAQHSPKMAQQRPNITSKWPNISPKPTKKNPNRKIFGLVFFFPARKPPAEPQMTQQRPNIALKWPNRGPT